MSEKPPPYTPLAEVYLQNSEHLRHLVYQYPLPCHVKYFVLACNDVNFGFKTEVSQVLSSRYLAHAVMHLSTTETIIVVAADKTETIQKALSSGLETATWTWVPQAVYFKLIRLKILPAKIPNAATILPTPLEARVLRSTSSGFLTLANLQPLPDPKSGATERLKHFLQSNVLEKAGQAVGSFIFTPFGHVGAAFGSTMDRSLEGTQQSYNDAQLKMKEIETNARLREKEMQYDAQKLQAQLQVQKEVRMRELEVQSEAQKLQVQVRMRELEVRLKEIEMHNNAANGSITVSLRQRKSV